jgi:phospholipid/cholesterol/gamma-HCH transport system substrate-binding protein
MWLRGLSLTRQYWTLEARFKQADGLAVRSPVVFRGVMVGTVRSVAISSEAVVAELEITNPSLRLARPAMAEIGQGSVLGGESQVALISQGPPLPADAPSPRAKDCDSVRMLCDGATIQGNAGASLTSLTSLMQRMLTQVEQEQLVAKVTKVATSIDQTAKEANAFLSEGRVLVKDGVVLVRSGVGLVNDGKALAKGLETSVQEVQPTLTNLNASSTHLWWRICSRPWPTPSDSPPSGTPLAGMCTGSPATPASSTACAAWPWAWASSSMSSTQPRPAPPRTRRPGKPPSSSSNRRS